ncbi:hypothetical protein M569_07877, partial [Genlisea aurea]
IVGVWRDMGGDKGKKLKLADADDESNGPNLIDAELLHTVEKLQEIQDELEKVNEEASEKVLEVEQKFNEIRKPIYEKRNEVIKSIPDFWLTAFITHPALSELVTAEDQKIFKYLTDLEVEDFKDLKSGYSISFKFSPNPYFEEAKLTKTFSFFEEGITKITATPIKWKNGTGTPNGIPEGKNGNKRPYAEDSFFAWFNESEHKGDAYEIHDEVADIIKDDLWPNPLTYFNNGADEENPETDDGEDDEGGESEESEGDDDDDEEEEED